MIVKLEHSDNYSVVSNNVYQGSGLSFRAMGLMGYLLSKPTDWRVIPEAISEDTGESVSMVRKVLKELRDKGFAELKYVHGGGSHYVIYEMRELRDSQNDELHETRNLQNNEVVESRNSQNNEVVEMGNSTGNEVVSNEMHETTSSSKREIHEMETILNTDSSQKKEDKDNYNHHQFISFENFKAKYAKNVQEVVWEMASRAWNELSEIDQVSAYEFITDYVELRTPKYRKHPHRFLSLREWENREVLQEIEDMKESSKLPNNQQNTSGNATRNSTTSKRKSRFTTSRPS